MQKAHSSIFVNNSGKFASIVPINHSKRVFESLFVTCYVIDEKRGTAFLTFEVNGQIWSDLGRVNCISGSWKYQLIFAQLEIEKRKF